MMAFMGVRMSWDMLKRKVLLARLALSAASLACRSSAVRRISSSMQRVMEMEYTSPVTFSIRIFRVSIQ